MTYSLISRTDHDQICTYPVFTSTILNLNSQSIKNFSWTKVKKLNDYIFAEFTKLNVPVNRNLSESEIEHLLSKVNVVFQDAIDQFVPSIKICTTNVQLQQATLDLKKQYRSKLRHFQRNYFLSNSQRTVLKSELNSLKLDLLANIKNDITNYYSSILVNINNIYSLYNVVGSKKNAKKFKTIDTLKDASGNQITGEKNICNLLANHFADNHSLSVNGSSVHDVCVANFVSSINPNTFVHFSNELSALPNASSALTSNLLVTSEDVTGVINSRKNRSAVGCDGIPNRILKLLDPNIIDFFTILFNHLIAAGYFPKCWRKAIVVPIPKSGKDTTCVTNWRPISLLSCLSKIFERLIACQIRNHINNTCAIPNHQFGFQPGHSTCHALALLQNKINDSLNESKITTLICLDIKAAFDTVWHDGLLFKLHKLGFPMHIINLISCFLSNRTFNVKFDSFSSDTKNVMAGVPQGSVLGPVLFNLYNHDIPTDSNFLMLQFADDTAIATSYHKPAGRESIINNYLCKLSNWFADWKLIVNEKKTELVHFVGNVRRVDPYRRRLIKKFEIKLNGIRLIPKKNVKYLGVHFSANNRFNQHISQSINKFHRAKNLINNLLYSQIINTKFKKFLYTVYLRPILTYAAPVWFNPSIVSSFQIEKLRLAERKAVRQVYNIRRPRHSFKYLSNKNLYKCYDYKRIDLYLAKLSFNFHNSCNLVNNLLIRSLTKNYDVNSSFANSNKSYKRSDYIYNSIRCNKLFNSCKQMDLFNQAAFKSNCLVYSIDQ